MKRLRRIFLARAAMSLAFAVLTTVGTWAKEAPTGLMVSNVSQKTADFGWNEADGVESYTVRYRAMPLPGGVKETFDSDIPDSWSQYKGLLSDVMNGNSLYDDESWLKSSYAFDSPNVQVNIYGSSCKYWLVSPSVKVVDGTLFRFDTALTKHNTSNSATAGDDDRFVVLISTDNGSSWTILREWNNAGSEYVLNNIPNTGQAVDDIDIRPYVGQTVRIAFYVESTQYNGDTDLHIDNVLIGAVGEWQTMTSNTHVVTITGLTHDTQYEAQVRCGDDGQWSDIVGFTTTTFVGHGTEEDPYMINNAEDLDLLAERVNAGNDFYGCYFKQGADIAYDPTVLTKDDGKSNFTAIGGDYNCFSGHFDGAGYTISGIVVCKGDDTNNYANWYQGIFGVIDSSGEVCNVHLANSSFTGCQSIGGIVGFNFDGSLHDCFVSGITVNANSSDCGAIAGYCSGSPERCYYYNCTVNGVENAIGVGCASADYTDNDGAVSVHSLILGGENITTSTTPSVTVGSTGYYVLGTTVTLGSAGVEVPAGKHIYYYVNGQEIDGHFFPMPAEDVTVSCQVLPVHVNLGATGWGSFYHEDGVTYSVSKGGAKVFYVSSITDEAVVLTPISAVPSGLPVLVHVNGNAERVELALNKDNISVPTDASANFHGTAAKLSADDYADESLAGHYVAGQTYVLSGGKFYLADTNQGIRPNRCWLTLDAPGEARLSLVISDATGIASVPSAKGVESWYDLQGRRLNGEPTRHGLYIYNGKKVKK